MFSPKIPQKSFRFTSRSHLSITVLILSPNTHTVAMAEPQGPPHHHNGLYRLCNYQFSHVKLPFLLLSTCFLIRAKAVVMRFGLVLGSHGENWPPLASSIIVLEEEPSCDGTSGAL